VSRFVIYRYSVPRVVLRSASCSVETNLVHDYYTNISSALRRVLTIFLNVTWFCMNLDRFFSFCTVCYVLYVLQVHCYQWVRLIVYDAVNLATYYYY